MHPSCFNGKRVAISHLGLLRETTVVGDQKPLSVLFLSLQKTLSTLLQHGGFQSYGDRTIPRPSTLVKSPLLTEVSAASASVEMCPDAEEWVSPDLCVLST